MFRDVPIKVNWQKQKFNLVQIDESDAVSIIITTAIQKQ